MPAAESCPAGCASVRLTAHSLALLPPDHERGDAEPSGEEEDPSNPELGLVVGDLREST